MGFYSQKSLAISKHTWFPFLLLFESFRINPQISGITGNRKWEAGLRTGSLQWLSLVLLLEKKTLLCVWTFRHMHDNYGIWPGTGKNSDKLSLTQLHKYFQIFLEALKLSQKFPKISKNSQKFPKCSNLSDSSRICKMPKFFKKIQTNLKNFQVESF